MKARLGGIRRKRGGREERLRRGEEGRNTLHNTYEDGVMKPANHHLKKAGGGMGNENVTTEATLFKVHCLACMELSQ
jgi:hypothetical protein